MWRSQRSWTVFWLALPVHGCETSIPNNHRVIHHLTSLVNEYYVDSLPGFFHQTSAFHVDSARVTQSIIHCNVVSIRNTVGLTDRERVFHTPEVCPVNMTYLTYLFVCSFFSRSFPFHYGHGRRRRQSGRSRGRDTHTRMPGRPTDPGVEESGRQPVPFSDHAGRGARRPADGRQQGILYNVPILCIVCTLCVVINSFVYTRWIHFWIHVRFSVDDEIDSWIKPFLN